MKAPCKNCPRRGCGKEHDTCKAYQDFVRERAVANARRGAEHEITGAVIAGFERIRGAKK
jgi:hypothetical protein